MMADSACDALRYRGKPSSLSSSTSASSSAAASSTSTSTSESSSTAAAAASSTASRVKKREFGIHMAEENTDYAHVNKLIWYFYALLLVYSLVASHFTEDPWYGQVLFYGVTLFLFCLWHRLAHQV